MTNTIRINHANQYVSRPVQLKTGWPNINSVRTNINTGRTNINSVMPRVNTVNTNVNTIRSRQLVPTRTSNSLSPKSPQGSAVKTSAGYNWRNSNLNSNCDIGPTFIRTMNAKGPKGLCPQEKLISLFHVQDNPLKNMVDRGDLLPLEVAKATYLHKVLFTETECFACLIAKATSDESKLWHRRLDSEEEESEAQGRKSQDDPLVSLVQ
ncbi:hypothetical protein Tco_0062933, partial [Tanacetum coccineum]